MQHRVVAGRQRLPRIPPAFWPAGAAWLIILGFTLTGQGAIIRHDHLLQDGPPLWLATVIFLLGWQVMLWAMMVPASLPVLDAQQGLRDGALFTGGYLALWTAFGLLVFLLDAGVHATVNHWPWLAAHPWLIAGGTLVLAGSFQLSDLKARSLAACRMLVHHPPGPFAAHRGALVSGLVYGARCLGASWALMLLAFALAPGSLALMAAITAIMVWEVTPAGAVTVKHVGYGLIAVGVLILAGPIQGPL